MRLALPPVTPTTAACLLLSASVCTAAPSSGWPALDVLARCAGAVVAADPAGDELLQRAIVSMGDTTRLQRALAKARRGEPVTIGSIGGSITQGASATTEENRYPNRLAAWWRETFPGTEIRLVNAGIGATGSNYGALRAQRDLLSANPDFVVVEYSVNDGNGLEWTETLEGVVRQILNRPSRPAVLQLFMMLNNGGNAQEWHSKIGVHYGLPMVSFRDAFWPEIEAGRAKWEDVMADVVHPNDRGHAAMADFIEQVCARVLQDLPADDALPEPGPVPEPLFTDAFERVALMEAEDLTPVENKGWTLDTNPAYNGHQSWRADQPGSVVEFEIEGRTILFMELHVRGPMGMARIQVDDRDPITVDSWFDQTWGGFRLTRELARDLAPGKHRVRVELLAERHAESTGNEFRILGLGAAGL